MVKPKNDKFDVCKLPPIEVIAFCLLGFVVGIIFFHQSADDTPISRNQARVITGNYEKYESSRNYFGIFINGKDYSIYPHIDTSKIEKELENLEKGTLIVALINPNNNLIVELKTPTHEILNFDQSQIDILKQEKLFVWLGVFLWIASFFIITIYFVERQAKKKEKVRFEESYKKRSYAIREASSDIKYKILLEAIQNDYIICYRRAKSINELVVNGIVYDEYKAILEFPHILYAEIDDHKIKAGYDEDSYSFIKFDEKVIARKKRII